MFSYMAGSLLKHDFVVPKGYDSLEAQETDIAICWFQYKEGDDIWSVAHGTVEKYIAQQRYEALPTDGWCSEYYPPDSHIADSNDSILGYISRKTNKMNEAAQRQNRAPCATTQIFRSPCSR